MTLEEARELVHGIYRLHWKDGGASLAAIGSLHDGTRWYAPTNWTAADKATIACTTWDHVERVDLIMGGAIDRGDRDDYLRRQRRMRRRR